MAGKRNVTSKDVIGNRTTSTKNLLQPEGETRIRPGDRFGPYFVRGCVKAHRVEGRTQDFWWLVKHDDHRIAELVLGEDLLAVAEQSG